MERQATVEAALAHRRRRWARGRRRGRRDRHRRLGGNTPAAKRPEPTKIAMTVRLDPGHGARLGSRPRPAAARLHPRAPAAPAAPRAPTSAGSAAAPAITDAVPPKRDPEHAGHQARRRLEQAPIKTGPVGPGSAGTKPNPGTKISTTTGPDKTGSAKPPPAAPAAPLLTGEESNQQLFAEYQQVNTQITTLEKALGAGTLQDLWQLYRHVGYYAAIQDTAKRQIPRQEPEHDPRRAREAQEALSEPNEPRAAGRRHCPRPADSFKAAASCGVVSKR